MIDLAHGKVHDKISQWHLIGILCVGIKYCKETTWVNSFKTVNIHPHHRVSFEEWVHSISSHLRTGEHNFYCTHQDSYYDAYPAVWKKMEVDDRQVVIQIIDSFVAASPEGISWTKEVLTKLARY